MIAGMGNRERAFIGLGANVGAPREALTRAVGALGQVPGASVEGISRLYRTRPVGPVEQGDFLNAVAVLRVSADRPPADAAMTLLRALKGIERDLGRVERQRWGPREVDLDLLLFGGHRIHVPRVPDARSDDPARGAAQWLEVPHPLAAERLFVLAPLSELAGGLEPPSWGVSVEEARVRAEGAEGPDAVVPIAEWDTVEGHWVDL